MFSIGQKVVCVDDRFNSQDAEFLMQLPTKGEVYTVRHVNIGRAGITGSVGASYKILLNELTNPPDPFISSRQEEMGFRADRFAEMIAIKESQSMEVGELQEAA